jgi:hypothetical protein
MDSDGMVRLNSADVERLLAGQRASTSNPADTTDDTLIYSNITEGQARIMTGDVGLERWQAAARRKTAIVHNKFCKDVRIMTGNQGGAAAENFNASFWD